MQSSFSNIEVQVFAFKVDHIVGNFCRVQFSRMIDLYHFAGLIFADMHTPAHCVGHIYCTFELISWF